MYNKGKSIKLNALLNSIRTILNLLFPLITFPYVSRVLTVDGIGKYNFSSSIVSYFLLIAALGIDKFAVREGAKYREDKKKISEFVSEVFSINTCSTIIAYGCLFVYLFYSKKAQSYLACILIFSLQIFFTTIGTEWLYSIFEEYTYITVRSIAFKIISIILLFAFVRKPGDYLNYACVTVFANVGSNVLNFFHARQFCSIHLTTKIPWKKILIPILVIFASNVAIQIYVSSDITMLGYLKDDYTVGIYSVSTKIYNVIKPVLAAALTVSIPRFSFYAGKNMKKEYNDLMDKVLNTLLIVTVPAMIGLIVLSKDIILILAGNNYLASQGSLQLLSVALIFSVFSTLFNQCALIPFKRERYSLVSSSLSAVENICLNFILIPLLAEKGAAITTVLAELTMAIMNFYKSKDIVGPTFRNRTTKRNFFSIIIGSVAVIFICLLSCHYIQNLVMQTVIAIIASVIIYIIVLLLLKNPIAQELISGIKKRMNVGNWKGKK